MTRKLAIPLASSLIGLTVAPAAAQAGEAPTAIVENADPGRQDLALFQMLPQGHRIELASGETLVLGYLESCNREIITGGRVVVGLERSVVDGGAVVRENVDCAGGRVTLDKSFEDKSAVVVFRKLPTKKPANDERGRITIHHVSPVLRLTAEASEVAVKRVDRPELIRRLAAPGNLVDFRAAGIALAPGGSYEVAAGGRRIVIGIAADANDGAGLLERLIVL